MLGKPTGKTSECEVRIAGVSESMKTMMVGGPTGGVTIAPTKGRRGVGHRGDMAVPYRNDSQAEVPDRQPSLAAGTQRPLTYCKVY